MRAGRAEGRVPSSRRPPRAVMRGRRATYPPRRVYVADLVTDYGREEVGTQSPTAAAQATLRLRPHVAPTSALMGLSRPLRRREQKAAQAADRTAASSPALPSPTPTASLRGHGRRRKKSCRLELCPLLAVSGIAEVTIQQLNRTGGRSGRSLGGGASLGAGRRGRLVEAGD